MEEMFGSIFCFGPALTLLCFEVLKVSVSVKTALIKEPEIQS